MPITPEPRREQPSTYFVQDRSSQEELKRLQLFDQQVTTVMGGLLPEQADLTLFSHVLDVGCGTGGWLIELAKTTPTCTMLVGVDAGRTFVEYARAQAEAAQVSDRVTFHVMDALRMLEFPDASFDLVNHRSAGSWLRTWDWPKLLQEYLRVCRPDGVVRITEPDAWVSNSPAHMRLQELSQQAFYQAGHLFTPSSEGVTGGLVQLLRQHGLHQIQTRAATQQYRAYTPEGQRFAENIQLAFRNAQPFLRKWVHVPENYEELYQQMLSEMQRPDFVATWKLLTVWGNR
ncbi:MAG TPA: methyltransferase domain-containing protein [Ktedonobacteraceae bacterium]|nr:methyltransferase domain-containing protein [Ktedonobacteraceae bacterium]